jgi:hypothetical protein
VAASSLIVIGGVCLLWREDFMLAEVGENRIGCTEGRGKSKGVEAEVAALELALA